MQKEGGGGERLCVVTASGRAGRIFFFYFRDKTSSLRQEKEKQDAQDAGGDRGGEGSKREGWSETLEKMVLSKGVKD